MPIDGHAYLVSKGWAGKGKGLRHDAISRPIVVAQKKTLSGIGKDRDEAFPFWDHVFSAAVSAVKIKVYDSDSEGSEPSSSKGLPLQRTTTGLISNRRPTTGTPALSGTATPTTDSSSSSGTSTPKVSVMTAAKQAAAKRTLYSMFYRGPVLANEFEATPAFSRNEAADESDEKVEEAVVEVTEVLQEVELEQKLAKRKRKREQDQVEDVEKEERRRRKREKIEKRMDILPGDSKKKKGKRREEVGSSSNPEEADAEPEILGNDRAAEKLAKAERKRLRAEKRARKEARRQRRAERASRKQVLTESEPSTQDDPIRTSELDNGETRVRRKTEREEGEEKISTHRRKKP